MSGTLKLPTPPAQYDRGDQASMRGAIERADAQNLKRQSSVSFLLLSSANGTVGKLTVADDGTLSWAAL